MGGDQCLWTGRRTPCTRHGHHAVTDGETEAGRKDVIPQLRAAGRARADTGTDRRGGPAGTTAATLLAQQGSDVVLLERERFPRYRIGESLLPSLLPILDIMGAREAVERHGFVRKDGAFYDWGGQQWPLRFDEPGRPATHNFQVIRSQFDRLLLQHAHRQGADVREETRVRHIAMPDSRVTSASWSAGERGLLWGYWLLSGYGLRAPVPWVGC